MSEVRFAGSQLLLNDRPYYVRGGEIQYFRLARSCWRERLLAAREGGVNLVSTYIPWFWHEPEEGHLDLTGRSHSGRDLAGFIELVGELGMQLIARPGPFLNSELRCGGLPEWLFRDHPEMMSKTATGTPGLGRPLPAEGEPCYRTRVREWYRQVNRVIAPQQVSRGGPVMLYQPDNELSAAWSYGLLNSLYDPEVLARHWPQWLAEKYGTLTELNRVLGGNHAQFAAVAPPRTFPATPAAKRLARDWLDFKRRFFADYGAELAAWAVADGIQVPFIFNEPVAGFYGHGDHAGFGAVLKGRGLVGTTALHMYSDRLLDLEGVVSSCLGVELTKSSPWGGPPLAVEINVNWYCPRLSRSNLNWETLLRLGLGHGLMGAVVYPYAAGEVGFAETIEAPEYFAPGALNQHGAKGESFDHLTRFHGFARTWEPELVGAPAVADLTVAYCPGQRLLDFLGAPPPSFATAARAEAGPGGELFDAEPSLDRGVGGPSHDWIDGYEGVSKQTAPPEASVWKKTREAILLLKRLNVSFAMLDLTNPNRPPGFGWLVVACTGSLERAAIDYLLAHLTAGGGCLFTPTLPVCDLDGNPDDRLAQLAGTVATGAVRPAGGQILDYGARVVEYGPNRDQLGVNGWIFKHAFPKGSQALAWFEGEPVVAALPLARGHLVVAGFDPIFSSVASEQFWRAVVEQTMAVAPTVSVTGAYCHALLRRGPAVDLLTVMNIAGVRGRSQVTVRRAAAGPAEVTFELELGYHEARCLVLGASLAGRKLLYATSELVAEEGSPAVWHLHGHPGTPGELAFAAPTTVVLDGRPVASEIRNGQQVVGYVHGLVPLRLELPG